MVGRKPEAPKKPDSIRNWEARYGLAPTSSTTDLLEPLFPPLEDLSREVPLTFMPQVPDGGAHVNKINAFTPVVEVPQAPLDRKIQDPSSLS